VLHIIILHYTQKLSSHKSSIFFKVSAKYWEYTLKDASIAPISEVSTAAALVLLIIWNGMTEVIQDWLIGSKINRGHVDDVSMKFPELLYCPTGREPCNLIVVKTCLCMFQLAPVMF
jgi:hypothetical protein